MVKKDETNRQCPVNVILIQRLLFTR